MAKQEAFLNTSIQAITQVDVMIGATIRGHWRRDQWFAVRWIWNFVSVAKRRGNSFFSDQGRATNEGFLAHNTFSFGTWRIVPYGFKPWDFWDIIKLYQTWPVISVISDHHPLFSSFSGHWKKRIASSELKWGTTKVFSKLEMAKNYRDITWIVWDLPNTIADLSKVM